MNSLLVSTLLLLGFGQAGSETATYTDPALHFTFRYPAEMTPAETGQQAAATTSGSTPKGSTGSVLQCVSFPLYVTHQQDDDHYELLMVQRTDFGCLKLTVGPGTIKEIAEKSAVAGLTGMGIATARPAVIYKLDGHDAVFAEGSALQDGKTAYGGAACVLVDRNALCWTVVTQDRAKLRAILSGPVAFAGRAGQPVVPPALLAP